MARAEKVERNYSKSDELMLEQAQTMRNLFETDKADFIALYLMLADPFSADWQTDIDAAQALPTAEEEEVALRVLTEDVEAQMELGRLQFMRMASYVKLLFPNSTAKQALFGLEQYSAARNKQMKMYDLLQLAYRMSNSADYKADLIALGFLQVEITKLDTIAGDLYDANELQEELKRELLVKTQTRLEAYNKVWDSAIAVSNASKQVYVDDYAKLQQYLLYPEGGGGLPSKVLNLVWDVNTNTFSWTMVPEADSYQLVYAPEGTTEWAEAYAGGGLYVMFSPGAGAWVFRCRAVNTEGSGAWSDELNILVPGGLPAPANVEVVYFPTPSDYIEVSWDSVVGATAYKLYHSIVPVGQPAGPFVGSEVPVTSPYVLNNPSAGMRYYYFVVATAPGKMSPHSATEYADVT